MSLCRERGWSCSGDREVQDLVLSELQTDPTAGEAEERRVHNDFVRSYNYSYPRSKMLYIPSMTNKFEGGAVQVGGISNC